MNEIFLENIKEKIYLTLLITMGFLNLSVNTHNTKIYFIISVSCLLYGILLFLTNIKKINFNYLSELIVLFCVINILTYIIFNHKKNVFDVLNIMNMSLALNYFNIMKRKWNIDICFFSNITIFVIIVFDLLCIINNKADLGYLKGLASHQNQLGAANVIGIMISIDMIRKRKNLFYFVTSLIFMGIIFLTKSRNSLIVSLFFILAYTWCIFFKKSKHKKIYNIISILIISTVIFAAIIFRYEIMQLLSRSEINQMDFFESMDIFTSGRWGMWTLIFPHVMNGHWLLGRGILNLPNIVKEMSLYNTIINKDSLLFWHNFIIDTIFNGGLISILLLMIIFLLYIKRMSTFFAKNNNAIYYIVQILTILVLCMLDIEFIWGPHILNVYLFILLGCVIYSSEKGTKKYEQ